MNGSRNGNHFYIGNEGFYPVIFIIQLRRKNNETRFGYIGGRNAQIGGKGDDKSTFAYDTTIIRETDEDPQGNQGKSNDTAIKPP